MPAPLTFALSQALDQALNFALPPRCPGCGAVVEATHRFCSRCWGGLDFLGAPCCAGCGVPFEHDRGEEARCVRCLAAPPPHAGVRAAVAYGAVARTLALRLKYGGRTADATTAARLMVRHLPADAALLVPVPLHRWRLWSRGYNQAALIADALARLSGVSTDARLLLRPRATPVLRGRSGSMRRQAVAGAFALAADGAARLAGVSVVLVDDVHTSGATSEACARVLLAGGAAKVTVLAWARVLGEGAHD